MTIPHVLSLKMQTSSKLFGIAVAFAILAAIAVGAGYGVDRLAVSLGMRPAVTLTLALITGAVILVGGGFFVRSHKGKEPGAFVRVVRADGATEDTHPKAP